MQQFCSPLLLLILCCATAAGGERLNIVFILADDL
jgi:hypothetical protein